MQTVLTSAFAPVACINKAPVQAKAAVPARVACAPKAFTNAKTTKQMLVWEPTNNK